MPKMIRLLLSLAFAGCLTFRAFGADPTPEPSPKDKPAEAEKKSPDKDKENPDKDKEPPAPVVTDHTITLPGGRVLKYKATAGYLTLRDTSEPKDAKPPTDKDGPTDPLKGKTLGVK